MADFRVLAASLLLVGSQIATADDMAPAPGAATYGPPAGYGYGQAPYGGGPYGGGAYGGGAPYGAGPYGAGPYGGAPYGGGYGAGPYNGGGPFNGGSPFSGGGPFGGMPFARSFDPNRPDAFNPMRRQVWGRGPEAWMNPWDPKEGMSDAWDDMMNAPHRMGRVPPGWKAPSIDIPNPIDVGDEFEKNSRRAPYIIRDNFSFN
ncbi:MAG: hypothetical protein WBM58_03520 [Sedimenticolaceae bacterium]|jgi:hypothetical protein